MIPRQIDNPYKNLYRLLIVFVFALNIFGVMGLMSKNEFFAATIGITQIILFAAAVTLLIKGRKDAIFITSIIGSSESATQWTYDENKWEPSASNEFDRIKRHFGIVLLVFLAAGAILGQNSFKNLTLESGLELGALLGLCIYIPGYLYGRDQYKRSMTPPFSAIIHPSALYIHNILYRWRPVIRTLVDVSFSNESSSLIFSYRSLTMVGFSQRTLTIPVPKGQRSDAETIASDFSRSLQRI